MTCHEARELFSAVVDDVLDAGEQATLDAHLIGCADCRRELDRLRRTVALVQGLPPERAPVGFVDRVVAAARPSPWPVRLARGLFVPWTTKLPLETAAILLVGGLAVWVFQRTPEQQESARLERVAPAPEAPAAPTPAPAAPSAPPAEKKLEESAPPATREPDELRARTETGERGADVQAPRAAQAPPAAPTPRPVEPPREEPSRESDVARDAMEKSKAESLQGAKATARALNVPGQADVSGRLTIDDPAGGAAALGELVGRLGGSVAVSRADGHERLVELTVPRDRYADFIREVDRLGRWQPEPEAASLPETVRLRIRLTH